MVVNTISLAYSCGFTNAASVSPSMLTTHAEVREMCAADKCHAYGQNWMCPPHCGSLHACEQGLHAYSHGLVVQSVGYIEDSFDYERMEQLEKQHLRHFRALQDAIRHDAASVLGLASGGCRICSACAYPEACRHPLLAYPSMEGYGLLVSEVCRIAGLRYYYGENAISYLALFLYTP